MTAPLDIIIMAAGKGTRMKSRHPKVLQKLAGRPLLQHVLDTAAQLQARSAVVVTGHGADQVEAAIGQSSAGIIQLAFARQEPQLGTGHAVQQAVPLLGDDGMAIVLSGDVPLTQASSLQALLDAAGSDGMALLTVKLPDPSGYGRIVRNAEGTVQRIVEQKDANADERAITEIYSGIMAVPVRRLKPWLARLNNHNAQGEYYLTDIVAMAVADGLAVEGHCITDALQVAGINSPQQLAELERAHQMRQAQALMAEGVRMADPARFDLRDDARGGKAQLLCGQDVEIDVGCIFGGQVRIGDGARIGAYCHISNAEIAADAVIHPFTHIDGEAAGAQVGEGALVGPFARLRPGAQLGKQVHIGNFVEVKNSRLADGAKANHLAYLGDAEVGERVNYGAGSITANYDGANKHRTVIEADVHVGSNCVLVAPVTIGAGGTVGGGSTITKSTPPGALSVARGKQVSIANWDRPQKKS
ncbi:bifunctional UDP-N-acetylglucosamine diphosphorylase/glucosamine-1-phosphate N-acetyltransferase GlmU [Comamonas piscis]|uniref:Bifunctional protein GlmU n=1 Tax=Comamonas piscis TaxID=1562974 RepID=A0A7G5EEF7_9BURK|nr:bifunctional UDP-N-acetylglucosamine diphosphorylase/glucosamine-1-phosphate N-acetyltransferase GlmU [Comamonas piscis]QMV72382.1 bifunctional UDP-N-acetylglucosamine diphosphorylase/glucosamine-1-phosphate N-acetyltransferase GlmU [Comamonas piscis]WSO35150.1 bifunctional UDP-N-acetylglucosamine diphosphorylase/glucosamine-1-phosphate N-acetyltransferase GlmU [Comamonas piscis]